MERKHVLECYFLSPEYDSRKREDIEKDDLESWLRQNTLDFNTFHVARSEHALCQVWVSERLFEDSAQAIPGTGSVEGPYRRLVKLRQMPSMQYIPWGLINKLAKEASYEQIPDTDAYIKKAGPKFTPGR